MAFDAGMLACMIHEIKTVALGGKIERVMQPGRDEIVLLMRSTDGGRRLLINTGSNNPRIGFTTTQKENPAQAPMLCMLLRKHLSGAKLADVVQEGFERVARFCFDTRDEMGFECRRYIIAEVMGKYSNLIFTDGDDRIIAAMKNVDFTTSSLRQVLPGMRYTLPPKQEKANPLDVTYEEFCDLYSKALSEQGCDKFITGAFLGVAASVAREICFRATRHTDTPIRCCTADELWEKFSDMINMIKAGSFTPTLVSDGKKPLEYAFCELTQYVGMDIEPYDSASDMLDNFFADRDREAGIHQKAADILKLLTKAETRVRRKLDAQKSELEDCAKGEEYRRYGELITSNLHLLNKGMSRAELTDYNQWNEDGTYGICAVPLDSRLTPNENAQKYFKKYAKSKTAKVELTKQIELDESELAYIYSVFDALAKAETAQDLTEIRDELYRSGYASKMKGYSLSRKQPVPVVAKYKTTGGYTVLCGKNNIQNEYITHKLADKNDWWFHTHNTPGSHVVMVCNGEEPDAQDFTDAAEIAAYFSRAEGAPGTAVDYLKVRNLKKVPGARPGFVIYHTNWMAYVSPDAEKIKTMRIK